MFGFLTKKKKTPPTIPSAHVVMECLTCSTCGCIFMFSATHVVCLRENHNVFYCPNGHRLAYGVQAGESENTKAKLNEATEEITKLKRQNLKLIHDREQMETKLSEGKKE